MFVKNLNNIWSNMERRCRVFLLHWYGISGIIIKFVNIWDWHILAHKQQKYDCIDRLTTDS